MGNMKLNPEGSLVEVSLVVGARLSGSSAVVDVGRPFDKNLVDYFSLAPSCDASAR